MPLYIHNNDYIQKRHKPNAAWDVKKLEQVCIVGRYTKPYSYFGKQFVKFINN